MDLSYQVISTPLGPFVLAGDESNLCYADFITGEIPQFPIDITAVHKTTPVLDLAMSQLKAYFAGTLQTFTVPYRLLGTPFREKVWEGLTTIPFGETISYEELACRIGNPKACRAVGQANHHNPISIIVPCHRVIGKHGQLVGYGGGLDKKDWLIKWEKLVREANDDGNSRNLFMQGL